MKPYRGEKFHKPLGRMALSPRLRGHAVLKRTSLLACFIPSLRIMSVVDFIYMVFLLFLGLKRLDELDKDSDHVKGL